MKNPVLPPVLIAALALAVLLLAACSLLLGDEPTYTYSGYSATIEVKTLD